MELTTELGPAELFESMCTAFEALDIDAFIALLDDEATAYFPYLPEPFPKQCRGREEIAGVFALVGQLFSELSWASKESIPTADPELIVARASSVAKLTNGDDYTNDYVFFIRARDGKIVEYREYFDTARVTAAFATLTV